MAKALTYQEVLKRLKKHDRRFAFYASGGKGSHQMIEHPDINGEARSAPIPCHKGKTVSKGVLGSIRRAFDLPKDIWE